MTHHRVYLVDDNPAFRASAQWWLTAAGYDVHDFEDAHSALDALRDRPSGGAACLLLDVNMPGLSGPALHARLRDQGAAIPTIYMTGRPEVAMAVRAMQQGAVSYLEKPLDEQALEEALQRAFGPAALLQVAPPLFRPQPPAPTDAAQRAWAQRIALLTPREREVHHWIIQDRLNKTISGLMGISIKTVELHRANLMRKLGARSLNHLVTMTVSGCVS